MTVASKNKKVLTAFPVYWRAYGGLAGLIFSPYLWFGLIFTLFTDDLWDKPDAFGAYLWPDIAISVLPSVIGFSLGAIAIILSLSSGKFLGIIQESGKSDSFFMKLIAVFFHFIIIQFLAIFLSIFVKVNPIFWFSFFGYWMFIYALFSGIAAAASLVSLAELRNAAAPLEKNP